jgi:hypothetical protein
MSFEESRLSKLFTEITWQSQDDLRLYARVYAGPAGGAAAAIL